MSQVVTGLQDGVKLVELFGGSRKKKIFCSSQIQVSDLTFYYIKLLAQCLSFLVLAFVHSS